MNTTTIGKYTVTYSRDRDGKAQAETVIPLGFDRRELRITTRKSFRPGIQSQAQVVQVSEDGKSHSFAMFADYNTRLEEDRMARCTEKTIAAMHARALEGIEDVLTAARAHYEKRDVAQLGNQLAEAA